MARKISLPLALWALTFAVFLASPVSQIADSRYSMLLSESILKRGSFDFDFDRNFPPRGEAGRLVEKSDYHFDEAGGRVAYRFPYGTSILSLPFVSVVNRFGVSAERPDGQYDQKGEERIERLIAALVCATLAVVLFRIAALWLSPEASSVAALAAVLGSQIWSTASRGLWSMTWESLLIAFAILMIAKAERESTPVSGPFLATILSWAYFCRPTAVLSIIAIALYMVRRQRRRALAFVIVGVGWFAVWLFFSKWIYGQHYSSTYVRRLPVKVGFRPEGFLGLLVSPSKGLLIYCPVVVVVAFLLVRYRKRLPGLPLLATSGMAVAMLWISVPTLDPGWIGGYSYGPRLMTEAVPWLFLAAVIALAGRSSALRLDPEARRRPGRRLELAALILSCTWGVFVNGRGAISVATAYWSAFPVSVTEQPSRVWDWKYPQFLAGILPMPQQAGAVSAVPAPPRTPARRP